MGFKFPLILCTGYVVTLYNNENAVEKGEPFCMFI